MPFVSVDPSAGHADFHYTLSTPTQASANIKELVLDIPTLLFLHPVYIAQETFQLQFSDPQLRRFNCIALDQRHHGLTKNGPVPFGYGVKEAAEDVVAFMTALQLPPCHVIGLSMGTIPAIRLAMDHPEWVASLILVSPLIMEEPQYVAEGREEIFSCWKEAFALDPPDSVALADGCYGAVQLGFSNEMDSLSSAIVARTTALALKRWEEKEAFESYERITVRYLVERHGYSNEELKAKLKCGVNLVHCAGDIAYPVDYTDRFARQLKECGIEFKFVVAAGAPHFGCASILGAGRINKAISDFVTSHTSLVIPPVLQPQAVTSPWEADLIAAGWSKDGYISSGSDSE